MPCGTNKTIRFIWVLIEAAKENVTLEGAFTAHHQINKALDTPGFVKLIFP